MIIPVAVNPVAAWSAFEIPKSVSITRPSWSNMMFAGFTSRWTTPRWCACPRAQAASHRTRWISGTGNGRSEEHTSELQSRLHLVCRLLLEKKKTMEGEDTPAEEAPIDASDKTDT